MRSGECHARTVRLFGWSPGANPNLWFLSPRQSQLAFCVRNGAEVMVEIRDPKLPQPGAQGSARLRRQLRSRVQAMAPCAAPNGSIARTASAPVR